MKNLSEKAQKIAVFLKGKSAGLFTNLALSDQKGEEKLISTIAECVLFQLRERFTHPFQFRTELREILLFMKQVQDANEIPSLSPSRQSTLLRAIFGIEEGILFSQLTQKFGIRRAAAKNLALHWIPAVLWVLSKDLNGTNGLSEWLASLGVSRQWLFLNVDAILSVVPQMKTQEQVYSRSPQQEVK